MPDRIPKSEKYKPGVSRAVLLLMAGIMWIGVGIMLDAISYSWLRYRSPSDILTIFTAGFAGALVIHHFGFLKIVDKNIRRILPMEGRRCVFSFIPARSYLLILIMMGLGFSLRHAPIPKIFLAPVYAAIGTALILSSVRYMRHLARVLTRNDR